MSPQMVKHLGLKRQTAENKNVVLANGHNISTNISVTTEFLVEAMETAGPSKIIFCCKCGAQHIDSGWHAENPHSEHKCTHCGHRWSVGKKTIGVSTYPLTDVKFEEVTFYVLEISCSIILGMTFLHDFSITINPRQQILLVPSVEGT